MKKISIHPATIFVWIWMLIVLGPLVALGCFFAIVIHECGHVVVAKILGYKMSKFSLSPYGCSLSYFDQTINYSDEIKIALAGPFANLLSAVFVIGFWWIFPSFYFFSSGFIFSSFALALFNLLPAYPLDGGRVFVALGSNYFSEKLARKLIVWFNLILSFFFMTLFVIFLFVNFNPTYFLVAFFLIVGVLDLANSTSFEKINIFNKKVKNFERPIFYCVDENCCLKEVLRKIEKKKTAVFLLTLNNGKVITLSEKKVVWLVSNFGYYVTLKEVFEKNK